jgi:excisionase family DNA binding protein
LQNAEARLAALESSSRVSSSSSSRTSNPDAAGVHGAAPPGLAYFKIGEVAETTRLSESCIRRAIRSGDLPASNVGTPDHPTWRISRKDLVEWMDMKKGGIKIPPYEQYRPGTSGSVRPDRCVAAAAPGQPGRQRSGPLRHGACVLFAYRTKLGAMLWIITEADCSSTCILLALEY